MNYLGVKTTGYRHPLDPSQWSKQTWGLVAAIVLVALLFATGISRRDAQDDGPGAPANPATTPGAKS